MKLCIDLCCGLGGFSQAFQQDYEVIKIDIERKFKPTIIADVCHLPLKGNLEPDVLLASPPCERFSVACPQWPKMGIKKALEIVGACFEAVAYLKPRRWLIENPRGRLRWLIGIPKQTIRYSDYDMKIKVRKLTDMWGNIPFPMVSNNRQTKKYHVQTRWFHNRVGTNRAEIAKIPLGVSEAVKQGCEI